jgi:hypothetical protein
MAAIRFSPCLSCRRHVVVGAQRCPFCATTLDAAPLLVVRTTSRRLSRAAVFAGVSLGGCWTSSAPSTPSTTPVIEEHHEQAPVAAAGSIRGVVRIEAGGNRAPNVKVTLRLADGSVRTTETDAHGAYGFDDVPEGRHVVSVPALGGSKRKGSDGTHAFDAIVAGGPATQIDVFLDLQPIPAPVKMPYGAPPVRRRVV